VNVYKSTGQNHSHKLRKGCSEWHKKDSKAEKYKTMLGKFFEYQKISIQKDPVKIKNHIVKKIVKLKIELVREKRWVRKAVMNRET
tara:strand:+ start:385 stop:642 length:258 start_codon:yes stop_codon:yes gene_type:complete